MKRLGGAITVLVLIACGAALYLDPSSRPARHVARTAPASVAASGKAAARQPIASGAAFATIIRRSSDRLAARWHGLCREVADLLPAQSATGPSAASAARLAILKQGDRLLAGGHFAQAADIFQKVCDAYPDDADSLEGLAVALVAAERFGDSLAVYQRLLKLDGDNPTTFFNYALALSRVHKSPQAQEAYRTLIARHENFLQARYNLASVYEADGKPSQACAQWKAVIALEPGMAYPHAKLGELLLEQGDAAAAMEELAQAAKLNPDDPAAWMNYSAAAQAAGSLGLAIVAANKAAKIAPASPADLARLGGLLIDLYERTGQDNLRRRALDAWRQCIKLYPDQDLVARMIRQYDKPATSQPATGKRL